MERFERLALQSYNGTPPTHWFRYVDDTLVKLKKSEQAPSLNTSTLLTRTSGSRRKAQHLVTTFVGNTDQNTVVTNLFSTPVEARFIRILPTAWHEHISFRFEVVGCQVCTLPKVLCSDDSACYDPSTQSCDGSNDCTDGSDEATCDQLRQMVAFMAVKTEAQTGAVGDVVTFQTNTGNAFNTATSIFTCPVSGFYLFNFRISIKPEEYPVISLMKNGIVVISTYESPEIESNYHISSNSALVQLVAGDEVKLQFQSLSGTIDHSTYGNSDKYEYSSFSGVMLY
ncbi:uncharacterized protein [Amphiura filiformis]|uniref:uncharacterized protein n=1 Tax=Amphiura filiformis TaxID=82378 RepID=UPI003B224C51